MKFKLSMLSRRWSIALRMGLCAGLLGISAACWWATSDHWLGRLPQIRSVGNSLSMSPWTARQFNQNLILATLPLGFLVGAFGYLIGRLGDQQHRKSDEISVYVLGAGYVLVAMFAWSQIPGWMQRPAADALRKVKHLTVLHDLPKQPPAVSILTLDQLDALLQAGNTIEGSFFDGGTTPGIVTFAEKVGLDGPYLPGLIEELNKAGFYATMGEPKSYNFPIDPRHKQDYDSKIAKLVDFAVKLSHYRDRFSNTPETVAVFDQSIGRFIEQTGKIHYNLDNGLLVDPKIIDLVELVASLEAIPDKEIAEGSATGLAHWNKQAQPAAAVKKSEPRYVAHVVTDALSVLSNNTVADQVVEEKLKDLTALVSRIGKLSKESGQFKEKFRPKFAEVRQELAEAKPAGGRATHLNVDQALSELKRTLLLEWSTDQIVQAPAIRRPGSTGAGGRRLWAVETVYATWKAKYKWAQFKDVPWPGSPGMTVEQVVIPRMDAKFLTAREDGQPEVNPYMFTFEEAIRIASAIMIDATRDYARLLIKEWDANLVEAGKDPNLPDPYPNRKRVRALMRETVKSEELDEWRKRVKSTGRTEILADTASNASPDLRKKSTEEVFTWVVDFKNSLEAFATANAEPDATLRNRLGVWVGYFYYGQGPGKPPVLPFDEYIAAAQTGVGALKPAEMVASILEPLARNPKPVALTDATREEPPKPGGVGVNSDDDGGTQTSPPEADPTDPDSKPKR